MKFLLVCPQSLYDAYLKQDSFFNWRRVMRITYSHHHVRHASLDTLFIVKGPSTVTADVVWIKKIIFYLFRLSMNPMKSPSLKWNILLSNIRLSWNFQEWMILVKNISRKNFIPMCRAKLWFRSEMSTYEYTIIIVCLEQYYGKVQCHLRRIFKKEWKLHVKD